jgi:hypothetical protein
MGALGFTNLSIGWNNEDIRSFTKGLKAYGGGDIPEVSICISLRLFGSSFVSQACKTALVAALEEVDPHRRTLILWYADAGMFLSPLASQALL